MKKLVVKLVQPFADLVWGSGPMQPRVRVDVFRLLKRKFHSVYAVAILVALVLLLLKLVLAVVVRLQ